MSKPELSKNDLNKRMAIQKGIYIPSLHRKKLRRRKMLMMAARGR